MGFLNHIVQVLSDKTLIDPESYERAYCTPSGEPLSPGYYIVMWPDDAEVTAYDQAALYIGPYRQILHARIMLHRYEEGYLPTSKLAAAARHPAHETALAL